MFRKNVLKSAALAVGLAAAPGLAAATTITVEQVGSDAFGRYADAGARITDTPVLPGGLNVRAGAFDVRSTGPGLVGEFIAWCVDIGTYLRLAHDYEIPDAPSYIDGTRQANIERLFETAFSGLDLENNADHSAGFQLALWELVYEDNADFELDSGTFYVENSAGAIAYGQGLLDVLDTASITQDYDVTFLKSAGTPSSQHLVTVSPVPLPAAGFLLIAGLGGLAAMRRRKSAA